MKNIFLDLGTHFGQGLNSFIDRYKMNDTWVIHTFEANPITHKIFKEQYHIKTPWVTSHNKAVSDHDGEIKINIESPPDEGETGMGSSIIDLSEWEPWGGTLKQNFKTEYIVPCIDFSSFILENFNKSDNIIIKMDIEGSEYHTLEKMINTGAILYVNSISVEWHSGFFVDEVKDSILKREYDIKNYIISNNINLEEWW